MPSAVARVLHEAGYELEEVATRPHPDKVRRFERAKPNQLWQTDLFTFVLKRQNRRVYLVAFMDDHSRFIVGYGLHASQSSALVLEVLRAALTSYGAPEEILTDNGTQYVTWRGKSAFSQGAGEARHQAGRGGAATAADAGEDRTLLGDACGVSASRARCSSTWAMPSSGSGCSSTITTSNGCTQGIDGLVPADRYLRRGVGGEADAAGTGGGQCPGAGTARRAEGAVLSDGPGGRQAGEHSCRGRARHPDRPGRDAARSRPAAPATADALPQPVCPAGVVTGLTDEEQEDAPGTSPLDGMLPPLQTPRSQTPTSAWR